MRKLKNEDRPQQEDKKAELERELAAAKLEYANRHKREVPLRAWEEDSMRYRVENLENNEIPKRVKNIAAIDVRIAETTATKKEFEALVLPSPPTPLPSLFLIFAFRFSQFPLPPHYFLS